MSALDREAERFYSDLQDHVEDVTTFYVSTTEVQEIVRRMLDDGHVTLPVRTAAGSNLESTDSDVTR